MKIEESLNVTIDETSPPSKTSPLVDDDLDEDQAIEAGCPTSRRPTSGYCVFLGNNLLFWSSKCRPMLSRSSAEAEYDDVANVVAETCLSSLCRISLSVCGYLHQGVTFCFVRGVSFQFERLVSSGQTAVER
nr:ribonuclease H-like domain-containing protein [Tanacetum cinerariifolium]